MGEKPEADEELKMQPGGGAGMAIGEEGVQKATGGREDRDQIAIEEEGIQRQGGTMSSIGNIRGREAAGGDGGATERGSLNSSRSNIYREAGGGPPDSPAEATNLNSSKSNTYREGGGVEAPEGEAAEGSVKSSKSNTSE
jgi:hypothetical protein